MSEKLKDYQVLDVLCGGTFYKVRHKVTNNIFAWKAYNCSAYSHEQIQIVTNEVKKISKVLTGTILRYYDTILHAPSKTLYFVLEHNSWRSVQELIAVCKANEKLIVESFIWYMLFELARVCKAVDNLTLDVLQKCITPASIYVGDNGDLRVNCFELAPPNHWRADMMRQLGDVIRTVCYQNDSFDKDINEFYYSDDLRDVVTFLTNERNDKLRPDVILFHPTVLANLETATGEKHSGNILVPVDHLHQMSNANKCDSEKAVELCRGVEPAPRSLVNILDSPIYCNVSPKWNRNKEIIETSTVNGSLSPTLAALALELPGFVPRSRKLYSEALEKYKCPQRVSEQTLSQQWMSRLVALRQREESLNKRERDVIAKEIVNSPTAKIISFSDTQDMVQSHSDSNGITLPLLVGGTEEKDSRLTRRRHPRSCSVRTKSRRKTYSYEDLDSSLSGDAGDGSFVVTARKFTKENMPCRNIFPDISTKKVHFTSSNPFTESDESVTLTFYELDNVNSAGYQVPPKEKAVKDIRMFKYLNLDKVTSDKRSAMQQLSHSSPSKQARVTNKIFNDITNTSVFNMKKTPSKSSLTSRASNTSKCSVTSSKSQFSAVFNSSKVSGDHISERTRSSTRLSLAQTPTNTQPDVKKAKSRKSLLPFKTPFKFKSSTKI